MRAKERMVTKGRVKFRSNFQPNSFKSVIKTHNEINESSKTIFIVTIWLFAPLSLSIVWQHLTRDRACTHLDTFLIYNFTLGTQQSHNLFVCLFVYVYISAFTIIFFRPQKRKLDYNWINFIIFSVLYGLFSIELFFSLNNYVQKTVIISR